MSQWANEWASGGNYYTTPSTGLDDLFRFQRLQNPSGFYYNQRFQNYYLQMPLNIQKPSTLITIERNEPNRSN